MTPYRIKQHRKRQHHGSHMALVPFIDMMTILVVFLLVNTAENDILTNTKDITVPLSISDKKPRETVVVMISKDNVMVDGRVIVTTQQIAASTDNLIPALKQELLSQNSKAIDNSAKSIAEREVTILGDRSVPYVVIKKVMATCTDADFGKVSLAVTERDGSTPAPAIAAPTA